MPRTFAHHKKDSRSRKKKQTDFLAKFEKYANISQACKSSKVPRRTLYSWVETDPLFKVEYDISKNIAVDLLEDEARRRAFQGTNEPVYQGGKKVGIVKKYSDTLLIFLLKCLKPDQYKDTIRNEMTGKNGEPIKTEATVISNVDYSQLPTETLDKIIAARIKVKD
jgi:hypothetical protein